MSDVDGCEEKGNAVGQEGGQRSAEGEKSKGGDMRQKREGPKQSEHEVNERRTGGAVDRCEANGGECCS